MRAFTATLVVLVSAILISATNAAPIPFSVDQDGQHLAIEAHCSDYPELCSKAEAPLSKRLFKMPYKTPKYIYKRELANDDGENTKVNDLQKRRRWDGRGYFWFG